MKSKPRFTVIQLHWADDASTKPAVADTADVNNYRQHLRTIGVFFGFLMLNASSSLRHFLYFFGSVTKLPHVVLHNSILYRTTWLATGQPSNERITSRTRQFFFVWYIM